MIYLFSGSTGSGKTYKAVKHVYKDWKRGIDIYTNIKLLFPQNKNGGKIYLFDTIDEIMDVTDGTILFDDAGVLFNAKSWEKIPIEFVHKLQLHRHHRLDMVATVPNIRSVHIDYRRLVHKWYYCSYVIKIGKQSNPRTYLTISMKTPKNVDDIHEAQDDTLAGNALNWRRKEKSGWPMIIHYWSKQYYDTHAKINFKRYKTIWIGDQRQKQAWIIPKEMSLKEGLKLFTLLNYQLNPKRLRK